MRIWERYFIKEFLKILSVFLGCFYGLYILIDYASHTSALPHHQIHIKGAELFRYYLFIFVSRAEILIPVALLIAFIKTVCTLNRHQELVTLMAGGIKLKTLLRPFIVIGLIFTALIFLNEQFLLPTALKKLRRIEDATKHQKRKPQMIAHSIVLEDGSLFLFQIYDTSKEQFFDSYWIQSIDSIYRIKFLSPLFPVPLGYFVDHLTRQPNGELDVVTSFSDHFFPDLHFNQEILQSTLIDSDALSLTELWSQLPPEKKAVLSERESKLYTSFYWKILIPWLCFFAIIAPAPICVRFSRQMPLFLIYACGIFGLIGVYLFLDAAQVISQRQVLDPMWAFGFPFVLLFTIFGWRFIKLS